MNQNQIETVIEQNNIATDFVVGTPGEPDADTAELTLRNAAVLSDRLSPYQFDQLGSESATALREAAKAAAELVPVSDEDKRKLPTETDAEYQHRVELELPLHRLQSVVSLGQLDTKNEGISASIKKAVWLGSTAFEKVMQDPATSDFRSVQETVRYFGGNTNAAAGRAERLRADD